MDQERPEGEPKVIDTNNFWTVFSNTNGEWGSRVVAKKKERWGATWLNFINEYPDHYKRACEAVARYDECYVPTSKVVIELFNEGKRPEATELSKQNSLQNVDVLQEMHKALSEVFEICVNLGIPAEDLLG